MPAKPKKALTGNISEHLILTFQYYRLEKMLLQEFDEEMAITCQMLTIRNLPFY